MECRFCGKEIPENEQHCPFCGRDLTSKETEKKKDYTPLIIVAVMIVIAIGVIAFSLHQKKEAERKAIEALNRGKPVGEVLQEANDNFQQEADRITDEIDQKMKELNESK